MLQDGTASFEASVGSVSNLADHCRGGALCCRLTPFEDGGVTGVHTSPVLGVAAILGSRAHFFRRVLCTMVLKLFVLGDTRPAVFFVRAVVPAGLFFLRTCMFAETGTQCGSN